MGVARKYSEEILSKARLDCGLDKSDNEVVS